MLNLEKPGEGRKTELENAGMWRSVWGGAGVGKEKVGKCCSKVWGMGKRRGGGGRGRGREKRGERVR
jgi:hypothetical protein